MLGNKSALTLSFLQKRKKEQKFTHLKTIEQTPLALAHAGS
jgi:hypothetical protein